MIRDRDDLEFRPTASYCRATYEDQVLGGKGRIRQEVLVKLERSNKKSAFRADDPTLGPGDKVIVRTEKGNRFGLIVSTPQRVLQVGKGPDNRVVRKVAPEDEFLINRNRRKETEAFGVCKTLIEGRKMPMKLINVEYLHGEHKAIFYFSAEGRVDFRDLVRELAGRLKLRIEMRQVGIRDEAKMIGGLGSCGRELCCSTFLSAFAPVTIKMVKNQNLVLNPQKVSGACGRLVCCLAYENDTYTELKKGLPPVGSFVETPEGIGRVFSLEILKRELRVSIGRKHDVSVSVDDVRVLSREETEEYKRRLERGEVEVRPSPKARADDSPAASRRQGPSRRRRSQTESAEGDEKKTDGKGGRRPRPKSVKPARDGEGSKRGRRGGRQAKGEARDTQAEAPSSPRGDKGPGAKDDDGKAPAKRRRKKRRSRRPKEKKE